jgi:CBS domain containing-hemolysin-like protein
MGDYASSILISLVLLVSSGWLIAWHIAAWRQARAQVTEARELSYRRRQYVRRMQTSAMLGLLGVAIIVGQVLTPWLRSVMFTVLFWGGVVVLVLWMGLLALADIVATQQHFGRLHNETLVERAKLQAEARRLQAGQGNGKPIGKNGR